MLYGCHCYVSRPHSAVGGSMVCNCHSHLLFAQEVFIILCFAKNLIPLMEAAYKQLVHPGVVWQCV